MIPLSPLLIQTLLYFSVTQNCLQRSFKAEVYCCPFCRAELGKNYKLAINTFLDTALNHLFPGYTKGR